ncbi:lysine N(6)-hydroxylase/L-ornithine N(5)-oxygenase family protein [Staphylococcus equorum]|nr:pyridine nucleotide-disulfide oxidoreductase [Staphylococcus equorum]MDG0843205.1 lysine N(6)-hydroxylase/L-ornithine N(5)-oxygenase family protein [Staphylococcus equorum]
MDHTHELIHHFDLNQSHIQSYANKIEKDDTQWFIQLNSNEWLHTDNLIIAFGCNHDTYTPQLFAQQPDISHVFDDNESFYTEASHVVGSGISAAHLCLRLLKENNNTIHLWTNKKIDVHDFDADPGWLGPKNMSSFNAIQSPEKKFDIIKRERHRGSMPKELELRLKKYIKQNRLIMHVNELTDVQHHHICTDNYCLYYDHILLATGFKNSIMQQPIIKQLTNHFQAPITSCGLPLISSTLEWLPNLFVTSGLADLVLGPFARNIMGGREAALRIAEAYDEIENKSNKKRAI